MINLSSKLYEFFSNFGLKAYARQSVPDDAALPYITYDITDPEWRETASISATVWYSGTTYSEIFKKVDEISNKVGEGLRIPVDSGGCVYIYKDTPFSQVQPTDDDNVRCVYLLFGVHALCI